MDFWAPLETEDPEIFQVVRDEEERTRSHLELIASESYPSLAVLQATGSILTGKYAEGYPGRRYYGGCEVVDVAENLARDRAREVFGAEHANVAEVVASLMPNMAHFAGLVAAGVHPSPIPHAQVVTTTTHKPLRGPRGGMILCNADLAKAIDKAVFPAIQGGPLEHVIAAKAVAFKQATSAEFRRDMAQTVANAQALAARLAERDGVVITGGTDNHLMLVDVRPWGVNGKEADAALGEVNITVNKNTIPYDPNPPAVGSGIRLGTPAVTSRGMHEAEMREIGNLIVDGVQARGDEAAQNRVKERVAAVADRFPVPGIPWTRERLGSAVAAGR